MPLYQEDLHTGDPHRLRYLAHLEQLIKDRYVTARANRAAWFTPDFSSADAFAESLEPFRQRFRELLGWPMVDGPDHTPTLREEFVAADELGTIHRVWVETLPGLETYGLLFTPSGDGPLPLVISQHGGGGTPELCSNLFQPANYNDMTRRAMRRGCMVFAPQLPMWADQYGAGLDRALLDRKLKHLGGSIIAMSIYQLQRCLDCLSADPHVDADRIGMLGLSWGGFYTLVTTALDTRIKAGLASSFLDDAETAARIPPLVWFDAANHLHLAEIAGLICPRPLYLEIGVKDDHVVVTRAAEEAARIREFYEQAQAGDRFVYNEHPDGHEIGKSDDGFDFLVGAL